MRRDAERIVVGGLQHRFRLDQVHADQQPPPWAPAHCALMAERKGERLLRREFPIDDPG